MAVATFKCEFPRRQAMLSIMELDMSPEEMMEYTYPTDLKFR
jgi:hypothetical protein